MASVEILVKGYAGEINGVEHASSTATLIRDGNVTIVVDPGMDRKALLGGLKRHGLKPEDVHFVVLTHTHVDHCLLAGIFTNAQIIDDSSVYSFEGTIVEHEGTVPGTGIKLLRTPGHDQFHCSVLVETEKLGKVVVAGDVFWWWDSEAQKTDRRSLLEHDDPYVKDGEALRESRERVLDVADYIIPGHGEMFRAGKKVA